MLLSSFVYILVAGDLMYGTPNHASYSVKVFATEEEAMSGFEEALEESPSSPRYNEWRITVLREKSGVNVSRFFGYVDLGSVPVFVDVCPGCDENGSILNPGGNTYLEMHPEKAEGRYYEYVQADVLKEHVIYKERG